ncbi:hypothetical protein AVEN_71356-1 [Araneus ventricosus]|uniref:Uncharacterized protein n=1 Tax=Araneus ventricosus TaxID=182803 RepID=A0A4Y2BHH7_ARAVE|nr:hypothetical protein AVEN_71356-1 [Araneus ventricosus]
MSSEQQEGRNRHLLYGHPLVNGRVPGESKPQKSPFPVHKSFQPFGRLPPNPSQRFFNEVLLAWPYTNRSEHVSRTRRVGTRAILPGVDSEL